MNFSAVHLRWSFLTIVLLGAVIVWSAVLGMQSGELVVAFLDVGQGDAIFIQSPSGNQLLLDGGPDRKVLAALGGVMPWNDRTLDLVVLSHPHADHLVGLLAALDRYEVRHVVSSGSPHETGEYENWEEMVSQEGSLVLSLHQGDRIDLGGGAVLDVLMPDHVAVKDEPHEGMLVMRLAYGSTSVMFTGDMEENLESELVLGYGSALESDVLKVGHHGSLTSTSLQFLNAVSPEYAVIGVGAKNRYGHPKAEVLSRLEEAGVETYRTDKDGTVVLVSDGKKISFKTNK